MKQRKIPQGKRIRTILFLVFFFCILCLSAIHSQGLMKIPLFMKDREVLVEVAKTVEERAVGLMGRTSLGKEEGMLFIFEDEGVHGFWMKNTLLPLSIAFIDRERKILWIAEMQPLTLSTHNPPGPILYALEMNKGWFAKNGIKVGDIVRFSK